MKKHLFRVSALFLVFTFCTLGVPVSLAADENACYDRITSEMVSIHDEWRARLFGSRRGSDGKIIALTGGETDRERTGIFETKGRLTSEIVEPLIESYRVYRCRSLAVCQIATKSFEVDGGRFDLKLLGCARQNVERYSQCYFAGEAAAADEGGKLQTAATNAVRNCHELVTKTLEAERAILRLAVAYDTGYRSLLQLAGMVDWMLEGFPTETVKAVATMVNMLGKLHQIPCFIGQCDNPNTEDLMP